MYQPLIPILLVLSPANYKKSTDVISEFQVITLLSIDACHNCIDFAVLSTDPLTNLHWPTGLEVVSST